MFATNGLPYSRCRIDACAIFLFVNHSSDSSFDGPSRITEFMSLRYSHGQHSSCNAPGPLSENLRRQFLNLKMLFFCERLP